MSVTITRTDWTDDDGTGTTGTVINNAEKQTLYDQIDEALAALEAEIGDPDVSSATGTLPVAHGGTGETSLTAHGVVVGNGTSGVSVTGAGTAGQALVSGGASADPSFAAFKPVAVVTSVALTDGASVAIDASLGFVFTLSAAGDRTVSVPTNLRDGQKFVIAHTASGGARTLTLTTGSSGAFRFGSDITSLSQTSSGKTDYIGCIYNAAAARCDVVAYVKGF